MANVTLKGKLKKGITHKISGSEARKGQEYWYVPVQIIEKEGAEIDREEIMLIFWKEIFSEPKTQQNIANLKENQVIVVHGSLQGKDNGLLHVLELVEIEDDSSDFII